MFLLEILIHLGFYNDFHNICDQGDLAKEQQIELNTYHQVKS